MKNKRGGDEVNIKRALLPIAVFVLLCLFAFLCAAAIAENEILAEYRWMVYLGVALLLVSFALFCVFIYFFSLAKAGREAVFYASLPKPEIAEERLGWLLSRCRTPALRAAVSLELAELYLRTSRPDRARSVLMIIDPGRPIVFDKKRHRALLEKCGETEKE